MGMSRRWILALMHNVKSKYGLFFALLAESIVWIFRHESFIAFETESLRAKRRASSELIEVLFKLRFVSRMLTLLHIA